MNTVVSIIVPVHNTEAFLPRCLDSLQEQTFRDLEIICVDDGSSDDSSKILRDYAVKDPRIVAVFQENHGVEWARSVAMERARGRYIMFCDSDDAYKPCMCERMVSAMEADGVDLATCGTALHGAFSPDYAKWLEKPDAISVPASDLDWDDCLWNKIFRRDAIDRSGLRFPRDPSIRRGFDSAFCFCYSLVAETASSLSEKLIDHFKREGSIQDDRRNMKLRSTLDTIRFLPVVLQFLDRNGIYANGRKRFLRWYDDALHACFLFGRSDEREEGMRLVSEAMESRRRDVAPDSPWIYAAMRRDRHAIERMLTGKGLPLRTMALGWASTLAHRALGWRHPKN